MADFDTNAAAGPSNVEEPLWTTPDVAEERTDNAGRDELYAVLNLPRDCSPEDIQRSYKRLATLLHPDRHSNPELKLAADSRFQALNRAYEVLSDAKQRAIYDSLGEEGLKTSWEVGTKYQTPEQMRAEFERLGRKQLETDLDNLVKARGDLTCTVDARVLFLSEAERRALGGPPNMTLSDRLATVTTKQLFLKHSFNTPITSATSVLLTSQLLSRQGVGAGNLLIKVLHRPSSKLSLELGTTLLRPRSFTLKSTYSPDSDTFISLDSGFKTLDSPPPISIVFGRRIFEQITGTFTLRSGVYALGPWGRSALEPVSSSTVSMGLISNTGYSIDLTTSLLGAQISTDYGRTVLGGVKVRVGGAVTSTGTFSTYVSGERRVTENTRAGMTLDLGANGVMTVKFRFMRLGQRLIFPIIIASSFNSTLAAGAVIVPAVSMIAVNHFVLVPRSRRRISSRISELRKENSDFIALKRKEADDAVLLLSEHVRRKVEEERRLNGLIIVNAVYGVLESQSTGTTPEDSRVYDVTVAVQALVASSQLSIPSGRSKSNLLGFFDCAMGEKKELRIEYEFKGRLHRFVGKDLSGVALPLRAHLVD